jgi:hypothetical protein
VSEKFSAEIQFHKIDPWRCFLSILLRQNSGHSLTLHILTAFEIKKCGNPKYCVFQNRGTLIALAGMYVCHKLTNDAEES